MKSKTWWLLAAGLILFGGCSSSRYVLLPTVRANAVVSGRAAADYPLPPATPKGDIRVATLGLHDLRHGETGARVRTLLVRMVVSNAGDTGPWSLDTREQLLTLGPGRTPLGPTSVNTDGRAAPIIEVAPGQKTVVDCYYRVPEGVDELGDIPGFDFTWRVRTPGGEFAQQTPFERFRVEPPRPPPSYFGFGAGYGPLWYYEPFWPSRPSVHPVPVRPRFRP